MNKQTKFNIQIKSNIKHILKQQMNYKLIKK